MNTVIRKEIVEMFNWLRDKCSNGDSDINAIYYSQEKLEDLLDRLCDEGEQ